MKVRIENLDENDVLTVARRLGYSNQGSTPIEYLENYFESWLMDILSNATVESKLTTLREDIQKKLDDKYGKKKERLV